MAFTFPSSSDDSNPTRFLPQHGFGPDIGFDTISRYHPFLFRVYTPRTLSPLKDESLFFVGPRFNAKFAPQTPLDSDGMDSDPAALTYEDCTKHLDWETRANSPFISTSFSFGWSLWDAVKRYNNGVKHDVEIAVIDARALVGKASTAVQLLRKKPDPDVGHHKLHGRWYRFAQESQSVLVHGFIPRSAVLASIPLLSIISNLPSYFLKPQPHPAGLSSLAWDYADTKRCTYRKFCIDLQTRFSRLPFQSRVRDLAVGSARLAIALLRPWFVENVLDERRFDLAIARTRDLAGLIAHWPEQSGSRDLAEMYGVMKGLILLVAEEVRSTNSRSTQRVREMTAGEVERLRSIVGDLEQVVKGQAIVIAQNAEILSRSCSPASQPESIVPRPIPIPLIVTSFRSAEWNAEGEERSPATSISPRDRSLKLIIPTHSSSLSSSSGSSPVSPFTPPHSPNASFHSPTPIKLHSARAEFLHDKFEETSSDGNYSARSAPTTPTLTELPEPLSTPPLPLPERSSSAPPADSLHLDELSPTKERHSSRSAPPACLYPAVHRDESPALPPSPLKISIPRPAPRDSHSTPITETTARYFTPASESSFSPFSPFFMVGVDHDSDESFSPSTSSSSSSIYIPDALSCAVTGFLVGAVVTLYILSSQRRVLLTHLS